MAAVFTKAKRGEVMSRIRSRGNADTELALAKLLRANRINYRLAPTGAVASGKRQRTAAARSFPLMSEDERR